MTKCIKDLKIGDFFIWELDTDWISFKDFCMLVERPLSPGQDYVFFNFTDNCAYHEFDGSLLVNPVGKKRASIILAKYFEEENNEEI